MVKSMTGYGRARQMRSGRDITVEVRSVNNRYLDCTVKMPRAYIFAEDAIKSRVQKAVSRGKVDVFITIDATGADETVVTVNEALARGMLIDATFGRKTASVFIMDSDHVVLSALSTEKMAPRLGLTVKDLTEEE